MTPLITTFHEKKLVGSRMIMSLAHNKTAELWMSFMPRRKFIQHTVNSDVISMSVYPSGHFRNFKPVNEFEKWAAVEVTSFDDVPDDMERYVVPSGLYAVFAYKGLSTDPAIFQYIFGTWLPASGYQLDDRPHVEVLGKHYKNNDPSSEEDIWIPITL